MSSQSPNLSLELPFPNLGRSPSSAELVASLQTSYSEGRLAPGARMPPVRLVAHQLGLSKNTVLAAYEELVDRGLLVSVKRQGFFVAASRSRAPAVPNSSRVLEPSLPQFRTDNFPAELTRAAPAAPAKGAAAGPIQLSSVQIDSALLPRERLEACFRSVLKNPGLKVRSDHRGYAPLREILAERLRKRGIDAQPDNILITNGSQQALDLVLKSLDRKVVATENPAYLFGKALGEMMGAKLVGLEVTPFSGIPMDAWRRTMQRERPSLMYLTSRFQNPTGYSYSSDELISILKLSRDTGAGILEDDWGSEMQSFTEFRPSLRALGGENVLYMNSFTKKLWPGLRLGYLLAPEAGRSALLAAKRASTLTTATVLELALFEFLDRGYYDTHLKKLHVETDRRYQMCLETLGALMPEGVSWTRPGGGSVLWLEFPRRVPLADLSKACLDRGVEIHSRGYGFFGTPHLHGFMIGFAAVPPKALLQGLEIVAAETRRFLGL